MDSLPLETLQQILELACTDGGSTGNALSLTSKYIRAAARRARFHTLRIAADSNTFEDFVAFFGRECNDERNGLGRPRVRHLYLTLARQQYITPETTQFLLSQPQAMLRILTGHEDDAPIFPTLFLERPSMRPSMPGIQELLRLVAPDLWSLVVYTACGQQGPRAKYPILKHTFPLVREAAFIGLGATHVLDSDEQRSPVFPVATHLHLCPRDDVDGHDLHLSTWSALAPRVTHLRASGIEGQNHVEELAEAMGVRVGPRTYPSIRYLFMEPAPQRFMHISRLAHAAGAQAFTWSDRLNDIVRECRRANINIQVRLLATPDVVRYGLACVDVLVGEWVDRVEGREGWWKELELMETGSLQGSPGL